MSYNIGRKIVIDHTKGGGMQLHNCFFLPTDLEGAFNVYDQNGKLLAAYVVDGEDFNFTVADVHFDIRKFRIDDFEAHGHWHTPDLAIAAQDGTFQAQSGGGMGEEEATSAASA